MPYKLGKLIPLETYALSIPKTHRYNAFMRQATLHSIIADLDEIIVSEESQKPTEISIWIFEAFVREPKKLLDIIPRRISDYIEPDTWVSTDDLGSGYDTRFIDVSWMDTREQAKSYG